MYLYRKKNIYMYTKSNGEKEKYIDPKFHSLCNLMQLADLEMTYAMILLLHKLKNSIVFVNAKFKCWQSYMEYILIDLATNLTHHSLRNSNPFILIYIIIIFMNQIVFNFGNITDCIIIALGFSDTGTFCCYNSEFYFIQTVCFQIFIDFCVSHSRLNRAFKCLLLQKIKKN